MFCKPAGITLHGGFTLRVVSDTGNIEIRVKQLSAGSYIDTGTNNAGSCTSPTPSPTLTQATVEGSLTVPR